MSNAGRLIKGSIFRNLEQFILLAATFVITPLIVHALGVRQYGFWTLIGVFIGYYGLMDFGLSSAAARHLSQALGKGDMDELNGVANTAFFLFSLMGLAVLLIALACSAAAPRLAADPVEGALLGKLLLMMGASTAIGFPMRVFTGVLIAHLRYDWISGLSIGRAVVMNGAIYWCLSRGMGIMAVAAVTIAADLLQHAATFSVCRIYFPHVRVAALRFDPARIRMMFGYGWKIFVLQLSDLFRFQLDSVLIAGFLSVSLLTPYSIGVRLADGFSRLVSNSIGMLLPLFSRYEGEGDFDSIRSALLLGTRLSALLSAFVGFGVIFYGPAFILRWMGPGFEGSYWVATILCAAFIIQLPQSPGVQLVCALSKHGPFAALTACEAALNLVLSLIFIRYYGMYGAALGTAVEMILFKLLVQPYYVCRVIQLPVRVYLGEMVLGTLAKSAAPLALYFFLIRDLVLPEYSRLALCVAAQAAVFIPAAYFFIITAAERRFINRALRLDERIMALGLGSRAS